MKIRLLLIGIVFLILGIAVAAKPPNAFIIVADDCTFSDLPINGCENARTPHIDALARQSLLFDRAYLVMAMCSPCRSESYNGRYPHRNGCAWNHGTCRCEDQKARWMTAPSGAPS